jgi:2,3-bisphosphoglycerate-dependent phosphoglycerate mutase
MQFYFIRHGQSENNALWDRIGSSLGRSVDPELTEVGRKQVELLAQFLAKQPQISAVDEYDPQNRMDFGITHLYTSLMVRAVISGTVIAEALGLPLLGWVDIHEAGGIYELNEETDERIGLPGNNRAFFKTHYPLLKIPGSVGEEGWWNRPFEEYEQVHYRARRVLTELINKHSNMDDKVAIISHGGFYNIFINQLLNCPQPDNAEEHLRGCDQWSLNKHWFILNNVAITRIDFIQDEINVVYMNRVDFIPQHLIT